MFTVGLTGGIASGKSAAAADFSALGAGIINTDTLAREVLAPGSEGLAEVVAAFGKHLLRADGCLDRRKLRHIIFADPCARKRLEAITHPRIRSLLRQRLHDLGDVPYAVVEIPLLAESGLSGELDRILVVDCPDELRLARLVERDAESEDRAREALAAQATQPERLAMADDVITNDGSREALRAAIGRLHKRYAEMARGHESHP